MSTAAELRERLEALADAPPTRSDEELLDAAQERAALPPQPPRRIAAVAAALVLVGAIAATAWWVDVDDDPAQVSTAPSTAVPSSLPLPEALPEMEAEAPIGDAVRWERLPLAPGGVSSQALVIPDGAFVWTVATEGGTEPYDQRLTLAGAAYDDATGTWSEVARPPQLRAVPRQHGEPDTVWTGDEVVLVAPTWSGQDGNAGELTTVRWRPGDPAARLAGLAQIPGPSRSEPNLQVRLTMDGDDVLALVTRFGGDDATPTAPTYLATHQLWRYDLGASDWTRLKDPPTTGDRIYGFEATPAGLLLTTSEPPPEGAGFNRYGAVLVDRRGPDGAWERLPPGPQAVTGQSAGATWDGERLVLISYAPSAAALDPATGTWTALPTPAIDGCEDYPAALATAGVVVTGYCRRFAAMNPGSSSWIELPTEPDVADWAIDAREGRVLGTRGDEETGQQHLVVLRWD